jgi:hypothetical protein
MTGTTGLSFCRQKSSPPYNNLFRFSRYKPEKKSQDGLILPAAQVFPAEGRCFFSGV